MVAKHSGRVLGIVLVLSVAMASPADAQRGRGRGGRGAPPEQPGVAELLRNAQAPDDATPEQLEQFDTAVLVTVVDAVADAVEPAPEQAVAVEWVGHDTTRSGSGETFVPFTVNVDRMQLETDDLGVYIRAVDKNAPPPPEGEVPTYAWDNIVFATLGSDRLTRYMVLEPGEYEVFVAVKGKSIDAATAAGPPFGLVHYDLSVPDYDSASLSSSTLIRFSGFDQIPGEPTAEQLNENPYIFGGNRFVRKYSTEYSPAGELAFIFWVYGIDTDGAGMPDLGVEFEFNRLTADGSEPFTRMEPSEYTADTVPAGFPVSAGVSVFNAAPLATFEPGEYQLVVTVTNRMADETLVHDVSFTVR